MRPIHVFVRHCNVSPNSVNKERPSWFSKEKAFQNLLETKDENTHVYVMLDTASVKDPGQHFTSKYDVDVVPMHGGTDAHSFRNMINHVCSLNKKISEDAIIYLLEDDYLHLPGWTMAMREAFDSKIAPYVTLYDHLDKYRHPLYKGLKSEVFVTESCHWRTTPSTTNTYAMLYGTLLSNKETHMKFSDLQVGYTFDHDKFLYLASIGQRLVSSIPGLSTHVEEEFLSPVIDWTDL